MRFITDISIEEAGTMCNRFFDYDDGDFAMSISDNMAMDSDGDLMLRMGDHMAMGYGHRRYSHDLIMGLMMTSKS